MEFTNGDELDQFVYDKIGFDRANKMLKELMKTFPDLLEDEESLIFDERKGMYFPKMSNKERYERMF